MEGPSLVIATEELAPFFSKKIQASNREEFIGKKLLSAMSWGKHLILRFSHADYRIHFLMFGSYRIDDPRENRIPKLHLEYKDHQIYFYSCAIKELIDSPENIYDWSIDTMSDQFDKKKARTSLSELPESMVCDVLMDQDIFAGVGNIIKNEVLYILKMCPTVKLKDLPKKQVDLLVRTTVQYCHQFYEWKKQNILKRNWKIFRKKICPNCQGPVTKKVTGKLQRVSHYCRRCQKINK